jgi:hypothetical protein
LASGTWTTDASRYSMPRHCSRASPTRNPNL